jgi:hypothetical protein
VNRVDAVVVAATVVEAAESALSEHPVMDTPIIRKILSARTIFAEWFMHNDYSAIY